MKLLTTILVSLISIAASAQERITIDDLGSIGLNLEESSTLPHVVHYPNYRMGGGNGAGRELQDCLLLDVKHSDAVVTVEQKLKLARKLEVRQFDFAGQAPVVKGTHVVFPIGGGTMYMTTIRVSSKSGDPLNEVVRRSLPPVRQGNGSTAPTALVYVRDCRF